MASTSLSLILKERNERQSQGGKRDVLSRDLSSESRIWNDFDEMNGRRRKKQLVAWSIKWEEASVDHREPGVYVAVLVVHLR